MLKEVVLVVALSSSGRQGAVLLAGHTSSEGGAHLQLLFMNVPSTLASQ